MAKKAVKKKVAPASKDVCCSGSCCFCKLILIALVIVFAWWPVSYGKWALTIIAIILGFYELNGKCFCRS